MLTCHMNCFGNSILSHSLCIKYARKGGRDTGPIKNLMFHDYGYGSD